MHKDLDKKNYGKDVYSAEAFKYRATKDIEPQRNIATFHFAPRPQLSKGSAMDDDPVPAAATAAVPAAATAAAAPQLASTLTDASSGVGVYDQRGTESIRTNISHSEHRIIHDFSDPENDMAKAVKWPVKQVVDWVFTERPACGDIWMFGNKIREGCASEIARIERHQLLRLHDVGNNPDLMPYGERDDIPEITVYSMFSGAEPIAQAAAETARGQRDSFFGSIRDKAKKQLYAELAKIFSVYGKAAQEVAAEQAESALSYWGKASSQKDAEQYNERLKQEFLNAIAHAKAEVTSYAAFAPLRQAAIAKLTARVKGAYALVKLNPPWVEAWAEDKLSYWNAYEKEKDPKGAYTEHLNRQIGQLAVQAMRAVGHEVRDAVRERLIGDVFKVYEAEYNAKYGEGEGDAQEYTQLEQQASACGNDLADPDDFDIKIDMSSDASFVKSCKTLEAVLSQHADEIFEKACGKKRQSAAT